MKTDTVFKRAFNDSLDLLSRLEDGQELPSENTLSFQLQVSRTTVRKVLAELPAQGTIAEAGSKRLVVADRVPARRFPDAETVPLSAQVEHRFMEWMHRENPRPGTSINELELARQFGVANTSNREFLTRYKR